MFDTKRQKARISEAITEQLVKSQVELFGQLVLAWWASKAKKGEDKLGPREWPGTGVLEAFAKKQLLPTRR